MPQLCTSLEFGECTTQEPRQHFWLRQPRLLQWVAAMPHYLH